MEDEIAESYRFRAEYITTMLPCIRADQMPFEFCRQGILKHILNERHNSREMCVSIYMQIIPAGSKSGQHRHMKEEIVYVLEGEGYDMHYNTNLHCDKSYIFEWEEDPIRYDWEEGDFIYVPPYVAHQHFNKSDKYVARLLCCTNRLLKAMGMDWIDQLAFCPEWPFFDGYKEKIVGLIHQDPGYSRDLPIWQ